LIVECFKGFPIGVVVANTYREAQNAARKVIVEYEELTPIITIEVPFSSLFLFLFLSLCLSLSLSFSFSFSFCSYFSLK
jgi:hypothetical protein